MTEPAKGVWAMIGACTIWGFAPIMYKELSHVPAVEVLAHRTFWSLAFFALILSVQGRIGVLRAAFSQPREVILMAIAAGFITVNWFLFIWAVQNNYAVEASLGYYIFPLVAVLIGRLVFGERLTNVQWGAVALAAMAVALLTYGLGAPPWIALILSTSFGMYGLVKKHITVGPVISVTAEVVILFPFTIAVLWWVNKDGNGAFGGDVYDTALLTFAGPVTATPLILFSYATKRISLATVGLVQYLNPTLQFFCAVAIFGEPFGMWHGGTFAIIWLALAIYSVATLRAQSSATPVT